MSTVLRAKIALETQEAAAKEALLRESLEDVAKAKAKIKAYNEALQVRILRSTPAPLTPKPLGAGGIHIPWVYV